MSTTSKSNPKLVIAIHDPRVRMMKTIIRARWSRVAISTGSIAVFLFFTVSTVAATSFPFWDYGPYGANSSGLDCDGQTTWDSYGYFRVRQCSYFQDSRSRWIEWGDQVVYTGTNGAGIFSVSIPTHLRMGATPCAWGICNAEVRLTVTLKVQNWNTGTIYQSDIFADACGYACWKEDERYVPANIVGESGLAWPALTRHLHELGRLAY